MMVLDRKTGLKRTGYLRRNGRLSRESDKRKLAKLNHDAIRLQVFERDHFTCQAAFIGYSKCFGHLTPHHILKASQGGEYSYENLVSLCCHHNDLIEADSNFARLVHHYGMHKYSWEGE